MKVRGFTLFELILVVVLIGVLAAVSLPMLTSGFNALTQQRETAEIEREAMLALDRISREVRLGRNVVATGDMVTLERDDPVVIIEITENGGNLVLIRDGSASTVLARNVGDVSFQLLSDESLADACYLLAQFRTTGVNELWRSTTYTRNQRCEP